MDLETTRLREVDQEIDGKMKWGRMEEASENGKELSHSAHASGMNEWGVYKFTK
jgi:hypothetical protein